MSCQFSVSRSALARAAALTCFVAVLTTACDDVECPAATVEVDGHCVLQSAAGIGASDPATPSNPGATGTMMSGVSNSGSSAVAGDGNPAPAASTTAGAAASTPSPAGTAATMGASGSIAPAAGGAAGLGANGTAGMSTAGSAGAGEAAPSAEPCTTAGAYRCTSGGNGAREQCVSGSWASVAACNQGEVCAGPDTSKPGECLQVAMVCENSKGARTCDGSGTLYQCDANGVIDMQTPCGKAELCMPGIRTGICAICAPGSHRCTGPALESCSPTGDAWLQGESCPSAALCDAKAGACKNATCMPGQKTCMGDALAQCNAMQTGYDTLKSCGQGMCNAARGECNACSPSALPRCEGTSVVTCASDGSKENTSSCPMYCNLGRCVECMDGASRECGSTNKTPPCKPGMQRCVGGTWGSCTQGVEPKTEIECNDVDEDCDGTPDDCPNSLLKCGLLNSASKEQCLPPGSYQSSCTRCVITGSTMQCACWNQGVNQTALGSPVDIHCSGDLAQVNGQVVCQ